MITTENKEQKKGGQKIGEQHYREQSNKKKINDE